MISSKLNLDPNLHYTKKKKNPINYTCASRELEGLNIKFNWSLDKESGTGN